MYLCDSKITKDDLEKVLQDYFNTKAVIKITDTKVISKGLGFLSDVMRVDFVWTNDGNKDQLPNRVLVKAPKTEHVNAIVEKIGGPNKLEDDFVATAHNLECKAYKILQQGNPIPVVKTYGCWPATNCHPGLIVMEDMSQKAGILNNIAEGVNLVQWKNVVTSLADLHAWSLTTDVPWRDQLPTIEGIRHMYEGFSVNMKHGLSQVRERYPTFFGNVNEDAVFKELDVDNMIENQKRFRAIMDDVMQHGDTWVNNILFNKNPDGSLTDTVAAFLDWQISSQGCGLNDLTRFETWCVNHEMRRSHHKEMLRFYYDRMMAKCGGKMKVSFEQVETIYRQSFVFNAALMLCMIEGMLHAIVRVDEDESGFRKNEMLTRARANYEDAASFAGWS